MNDRHPPALPEQLRQLAQPYQPGPARAGGALCRIDAPAAWLAGHGGADLFLVAPDGLRHFLLCAAPGQPLLLAPCAADGGWSLALVPAAGASLCRLPLAQLQALLDQAPPAQAAALLGELAAPLADNSGLAPASAAAVADLCRALCGRAIAAAARGQEEELARLARQRRLNGEAMAGALEGMAALIQGGAAPAAPGDPDNRLLAACRLVGGHAGIAFQAPPLSGGPPGGKLAAIVRASGARMRMVVLKDAWWRHDNGALLGLTEDKLPLALLPAPGGGYRIHDPVSGAQREVDAASAATLLPHAYMFYRGLPAAPLAWTDLARFVARDARGDLPAVAAIALASTVLAMAIPLASGHLFDSVFPAADRGQMVQVVAMLFIASLVTLMLEAARAVATLRIEGKAGSGLQAAVWDRVLKLPAPFFRRYTAGDLATRINGINEIRQALSGNVIATVINSVFSLCNLLLLLHYSARLALMALALLAVAAGFNLALGHASLRVTRVAGELRGRLAGQVFEYLGGIAKLRMTGAEGRAFANWAARFTEHKRHALRAGRLANASAVFGAAFPVAASAMLFAGIAGMLAEQEVAHLSSGDFIAFNAAWTVLLAAALSLVRTGMDVLSIASTYERAQPILQAEPEMDASQAEPGELSGAIELSHVSFSYTPGGPPVLDDLSLSIRPGEFVALVGASGSGKSTLLRLLLGFEHPSHGGIYYDGHLLGDINIGSLRRQLGVVLQSGRLAGGDIFSNIAGGGTLTLDEAWAAARACGLEQDIEAMPMGMHTIIGDGGGTLSGGQRQRLLVARALARRPRILFFDEATSALDNRSQAIVSASMEQLKATRVVIAHRLSTIRNADRIYVLDRGRIAECGAYDELMARDGAFASLARRQLV